MKDILSKAPSNAIQAIKEYLRVELLDKLYIDNIIDKTGKLIVKVDSK